MSKHQEDHKEKVNYLKLFFTGMVQVFFVAINTYFLSKEIFLAVFLTSFMISLIWSYNVKKVVFGTPISRISYALGAATGSIIGLWSSKVVFFHFFNG